MVLILDGNSEYVAHLAHGGKYVFFLKFFFILSNQMT